METIPKTIPVTVSAYEKVKGRERMRKCGILLPIASLPSAYGIGCFSKEAYEFIDQLKKAGQHYWQILPLGPTGYGDSPYQSFSTFAGNPYFIDLEQLIEEGLLEKSECDAVNFGDDEGFVDYGTIYNERFKILRKAFEKFEVDGNEKFIAFCKKEKAWLNDYAMYMAIKNSLDGVSFIEWDKSIRFREEAAMQKYEKELREEIEFYKFMQFEFSVQWKKLKKYANKQGVKIVGDIPIYVAFDSADTWANPELFQFTSEGLPKGVAGCPPDAFSETGQLWGNPLYDWKYHKKTGYAWWIKRIAHCYELYDVVRIDHFRGFDEYYSIPYGDETAENGKWKKGPGISIFKAINKALGEKEIIAEDLGYLTDSVIKLVEDTGYPGMKILQFAFDSREESDYLPHNYNKNCVVYTGTHDNDTVVSWFEELVEEDKQLALDYLGVKDLEGEEVYWSFIRMAMASTAQTCIIPLQDYLGLGGEARINLPSTVGKNWKWRLKKGEVSKKLLKEIKRVSVLYGRK